MDGSNVLGEYIYNGKGQRAEKWIPSQNKCTIFHYDQNGLLITETTSAGNIKAEYVNLNGQPLAKIEGNNIYYYHNDHLGSPMLMTDSTGSVAWQGEFKPFGEPLSVTGSITNNLRFPGQYYDAETDLHQNYFRDYKPEIGRYVEADPIGLEGGINLFSYVANNPTNWIDPEGEKCKPFDSRTTIKKGWHDPAQEYQCVELMYYGQLISETREIEDCKCTEKCKYGIYKKWRFISKRADGSYNSGSKWKTPVFIKFVEIKQSCS